jgi:hypothetical protein
MQKNNLFKIFIASIFLTLLSACGGGGSDSSSSSSNSSSSTSPTTSPQSYNFGVSQVADSTSGVLCSYSYSAPNPTVTGNLQSTSVLTCDASQRTQKANGIPDHPVGTFPNPNNPNSIGIKAVSWNMPFTPVKKPTSSAYSPSGYAFNGVMFDPATGGGCPSTATSTSSCSLVGMSTWNIEAIEPIQTFNFGIDSNNAHVQPDGAYHYHGMPTGILTEMNKGTAMTLVGFAVDGFPIYARYGVTNTGNPASSTKVMVSSYQLKSTPSSGRPSTATFPMGTFTQDYSYVAGSGDLDQCNGRYGATPEFPKGIYQYFITDSYPYIQRCVFGTPTTGVPQPPT